MDDFAILSILSLTLHWISSNLYGSSNLGTFLGNPVTFYPFNVPVPGPVPVWLLGLLGLLEQFVMNEVYNLNLLIVDCIFGLDF